MGNLVPEERRVRRRFETAVRRYSLDNGLLPEGERILVAVSGGPDSTALLLALNQLSHRGGFELAVGYLDHGLRGPQAAGREEAFVRDLATSRGLPVLVGHADVRARGRGRKQSIETAAREERYSFLLKSAHEAGCSLVATGHTASDQAETVLMHLLRGSGLGGLSGIAPRSAWPFGPDTKVGLIRPLLSVTRADTLSYCAALGIEALTDESNESPEFLRNRLRQELIPSLRQYNHDVEAALVRLADAARADNAVLDHLAEGAIERIDGGISLSRELLNGWPQALRRRACIAAYEALLGDARDVSQRHLTALDRLLTHGQTGDHLDLPRGVSATLKQESLVFASDPVARAMPEDCAHLPVPGEAMFGELSLRAGGPAILTAVVVEVDAEAAGNRLAVRRRRPGDRFQPLGMRETKKLQDFLVDEHVPRSERDSIPIFENERGIIWVGGLRIADWARPVPGRPVVCLSYVSA
jgi:tRNA(Ile)-lysidine synthase